MTTRRDARYTRKDAEVLCEITRAAVLKVERAVIRKLVKKQKREVAVGVRLANAGQWLGYRFACDDLLAAMAQRGKR